MSIKFNWIDLAILIVLVRALIIGIRSVFSKELARCLSVIIAMIGALVIEVHLKNFFAVHEIAFKEYIVVLLTALVFVAAYVLAYMAAAKIITFSFFKKLDKTLSVVASIGANALWCGMALYCMLQLPWAYGAYSVTEASYSGNYFVALPMLVSNGFSNVCAGASTLFEGMSRSVR